MSNTPENQPKGDLNINSGGDVNVGGDVAGRDVVKNTTTTTVTNVGFSEKAVQRLLLMVGAMVFVTAACFFTGGLAIGFAAFPALSKQVGSSQPAAQSFQQKLAEVQALPAGQPAQINFTEDEISSYVKFIIGPQLGFAPESGRARFVDDTSLVIAGQLTDANNLPVAATFQLSNEPGQPLKLTGAAAQLFDTNSAFGWVAVPTGMLQPVQDRLNSLLSNVQLVSATAIKDDPQNPTWQLNVLTR
jgi:hypothetical protein